MDGPVRRVVAVKELRQIGAADEREAMREFAFLSHLPPHSNVVRVLGVKSTVSIFYVLLEFCCFALDAQHQRSVPSSTPARPAARAWEPWC